MVCLSTHSRERKVKGFLVLMSHLSEPSQKVGRKYKHSLDGFQKYNVRIIFTEITITCYDNTTENIGNFLIVQLEVL